jgi:hypothetical protein
MESEVGELVTYLHHQLADIHHCYFLRFGGPSAENSFVNLSEGEPDGMLTLRSVHGLPAPEDSLDRDVRIESRIGMCCGSAEVQCM